MTSLGDTSNSNVASGARVDGVPLENLTQAAPQARFGSKTLTDKSHRFWASNERYMVNTHRDIMQISFGSERLVNHLSFDVSRFPLNMRVEYQDRNGYWQGLTYADTSKVTRRVRGKKRVIVRHRKKNPVKVAISNSVPARVRSARFTKTLGQWHRSHWLHESWKLTPVRTSKIRFVFTRNHNGKPPRDFHGRKVAYSVALRKVQIGYRVVSYDDIPTPQPDQPWWASSSDILGSRVVYSTYQQDASRAVDGNHDTFWRSDPQPFPFAVANMFMDLRDENGIAPVVDRWWVDPVTIGPACNVYWSNTVPTGDFDGLSEPIPSQFRQEIGIPRKISDGVSGRVYQVALGPDAAVGYQVSNFFQRMHYEHPWWVGIDAESLVGATIEEDHPLVSIGTTQILQSGATLQVVSQTGESASVQLDPAIYQPNSPYRLVVSYFPYDPATQRDSYLRLTYKAEGYDPITSEMVTRPLEFADLPIRIGLHPDPGDVSVPAVSIKGLVLKSEALDEEVEEWFLDEGAEFVADADTSYDDRGTSQNARLRMHPMFISVTNPFGVVGGAGNRFDEMEWTPINRDYVLKQGYMHVPPTRAKYWKFEMTNLAPEVYENFVTIDRDVLVFPPDVVNHNDVLSAQSNNATPSGVAAIGNLSDNVAYSDVLNSLAHQQSAPPTATQVLVVKDPVQAQEIAQTGWVWNYQPWHMGSKAPRFPSTQQHYYEEISVRHQTKVAYFAGLRELVPYRTDYTFDDDTPEYVEHLLDTEYVQSTDGLLVYEGGVLTTGSDAEITSKRLLSYEKVRGVQFATQETNVIQVMSDPDFRIGDLSRWTAYGDAQVVRIDDSDVLVSRGWIQNYYGTLEARTYGEMDGVLYGALEGGVPEIGYSEGGIVSEVHSPMGAGKVVAQAIISTADQLTSPVVVEIVSEHTGNVVARAEQRLNQGETTKIEVGYAPGSLSQRFTYGDIEDFLRTRAEIEGGTHYVIAEGTSDFNDDTFITAASGDPATSYATLDPTVDDNGPDDWSLFSGDFTLHVRYQSPVGVTLNLWDDTLSEEFGTQAVPASEDEVAEVTIDCTSTPGNVLPDLKLGVVVGSSDRPDVKVMDWWIETVDAIQEAGDTTYGDLEIFNYSEMESIFIQSDLYVRVRQQGQSRDSFHIHRLALYDSPIAWFFSNDDGTNWWQAIDVANDPYGVLLFPERHVGDPANTAEGAAQRALRWKAHFYREGAALTALHIRPWYGNRSRTAERAHTLDSLGPNRSIYDNFPATTDHPMWLPRPLPDSPDETVPVPPPFWRNMAPDPSGENTDQGLGNWTGTGGTVETGFIRPGPDLIYLGVDLIVPDEQFPIVAGDPMAIIIPEE